MKICKNCGRSAFWCNKNSPCKKFEAERCNVCDGNGFLGNNEGKIVNCPACSAEKNHSPQDRLGSIPLQLVDGSKSEGKSSDVESSASSGDFNLSDKVWVEQLMSKPKGTECFFLNVKDVKTFIKKLKETSGLDTIFVDGDADEIIDKLAGDKLR